jgi:acyl carrier protein
MTMTRDEIYDKVQGVLVDALGVDEDEVKPEATLREDLGAESIDFLDIVFRLEKAFTADPSQPFKIPRGELFPENVLTDPKYVQNGRVTPEGLEELKRRMPHSDFSSFEDDPQVERMQSLFTVDAIVNYVETKLERK